MAHASGSRVAEPKAYATFYVAVPDVQEALDRLRRGEGARTVLVLDEDLAGVQIGDRQEVA